MKIYINALSLGTDAATVSYAQLISVEEKQADRRVSPSAQVILYRDWRPWRRMWTCSQCPWWLTVHDDVLSFAWAAVLAQVFHTIPGGHLQPLLHAPLLHGRRSQAWCSQELQVATFSRCFTVLSFMGTRSRASTSNTPGGHLWSAFRHVLLLHGHRFFVQSISYTPGDHLQPLLHASSCHSHPFSCKYFKHSRWPPPAATTLAHSTGTRSHPMDTHSRSQVFQTLRVATFSASLHTLIPRAPVLVQVLQTLQVIPLAAASQAPYPWTPVLVGVFPNTPGGRLQP